jgi:WhiB family redox-sensing transcriptional regulator
VPDGPLWFGAGQGGHDLDMERVTKRGGRRDGGWRDRAECRNLDTNLFFPNGESGDAAALADAAKSVCTVCAVRTECLEFALDTNQPSGVFGGLTEDERRSLRRRRARDRHQAS